MHDLTGFQRDCLYVIAGLDHPHGLRIKDELENYYETEINHGRLYPNLDELVNRELVEKGELDQRTNYYELADEGKRAIAAREQWEAEFVDEDEIETVTSLAQREDEEQEQEQEEAEPTAD